MLVPGPVVVSPVFGGVGLVSLRLRSGTSDFAQEVSLAFRRRPRWLGCIPARAARAAPALRLPGLPRLVRAGSGSLFRRGLAFALHPAASVGRASAAADSLRDGDRSRRSVSARRRALANSERGEGHAVQRPMVQGDRIAVRSASDAQTAY